jgi:FlaA1/EpsC-like NDP-sugar epimerase
MSYQLRLTTLILIDSVIVLISIYLSHFFLNPYATTFNTLIIVSSLILLFSHHIFSHSLNLYRRAWRYASIDELVGILIVVTSSILLTVLCQWLFFQAIYERALAITWMLHILLLGGVRFAWRYYRNPRFGFTFFKKRGRGKRTLIIGAGSAGRMLAKQLKENFSTDLMPVAFLDDDIHLHQLKIFGINVAGSIQDLSDVVKRSSIEHIIIAIPSLDRKRRNEIITQAKMVCENVQILPLIEDLVLGRVSISEIKDVSIEDLLEREPVDLDTQSISEELHGQTVLVTGAGGSIGSEICRQVRKFHPEKLVLVGHGEYSIYNIDMELRQHYDDEVEIIPIIGDVQDRTKMFEVMDNYRPDVVYHAAAHKHVPLMEANPVEAVKNNIFGTKNVAEAADRVSVQAFVLVSSDKAVNPPNIMGATKRFAEMFIQNMAKESSTKFAAVRFGNVLGSRGSVIPLFKKQIETGGPVTVTHPDMTRYFMTIPEASRLVIQAGVLARGGEVFVLDMGEPVRIIDLAKNLIALSGYTEEEIGIQFSGTRPGEKMYEELLSDNEIQQKQVFPKIHIGKAEPLNKEQLTMLISILLEMSATEMKEVLIEMANTNDYQYEHLQVVK